MAKVQGGTLEWNGAKLIAAATAVNIEAMKKAAITVQANAKILIGGPGSGRLYRRKNGITHRASSPGKPPARDTGILATSVDYEVSVNHGRVTGRVGPDIDKIRQKKPRTNPDYGHFLDVGVKKGKRVIRPRPWLKPALIKSRKKILTFFKIANSRL